MTKAGIKNLQAKMTTSGVTLEQLAEVLAGTLSAEKARREEAEKILKSVKQYPEMVALLVECMSSASDPSIMVTHHLTLGFSPYSVPPASCLCIP